MRWRFGLALLAGAAVILLAFPGTALGHAALVTSTPGANAFLKLPPAEISLVFSEQVDSRSSSIKLLDAAGKPITIDPATVLADGATLRATLPKLEPGIYNVLWSNVSHIDGHANQGAFPFTVLNEDGSLPDQVNTVGGITSDNDPPPEDDGVAVRALSLLGLALTGGGALILLLSAGGLARADRGLTWMIAAGAAVLAAAVLLNLAVLRDVYSSVSFRYLVLETRTGGYWLARLGAVLFAAVAASFIRDYRRAGPAAVLAAMGVFLWSYTATSHAAAGAGSAWASVIDLLHGGAAIAWIGAVIGIVVAARLAWREGTYAPVMARFSLLASAMVFILLATGTLSTFVEVESPDQLWNTRWGVTLLVKLALVVPLLLVALYNAKRGRPRLEALAAGEPRRFIATAGGEALLGIAVFAAAAILTQTTVAKSVIDLTGGKPFDQTQTASDITSRLSIDPNRTGLNTYTVTLDSGGKAVTNASRVRLTFRYQDDQTIGPSTLDLAPSGSVLGQYTGAGPFLTLEGQWRVEVEVRRPDVDDVTVFYDVRPAGLAVAGVARGNAWSDPAANLTWNQFGGVVALLAGLGAALFKGRLPRRREVAWSANGATLLGFGVGALLLFGVHSHTTTATLPKNPIFPDENSIARGRELYQQNCAACHGINGVPPQGLDLDPYPLDLTVHVPQHPDGQLFNFISQGIPGSAMRAWSGGDPKLTGDQIWHIVNYLRTLGTVDR